jgi:hypothetical protein
MDPDKRGEGIVIDLDRLEAHAKDLYLHRFVEGVRQVRRYNGRYLVLRSGDETAIRAADDGSAESLDEIIAEPEKKP